MQDVEPARTQFAHAIRDRTRVRQFELHADLRTRHVTRPPPGAETGLRGLGERPDTEVTAPGDLIAGDVLTVKALKRQPEHAYVEVVTCRDVGVITAMLVTDSTSMTTSSQLPH